MSAKELAPAPISEVRSRIAAILDQSANVSLRKPVVIFAVDGISFDIAKRVWPRAQSERLLSVFPTTSSTAWLTSLTGLEVSAHGIPGVVFRLPNQCSDPINVLSYSGPIETSVDENIFSDAASRGFQPLAIASDLDAYNCTWRELLLKHSRRVRSDAFCTPKLAAQDTFDPDELVNQIDEAVQSALSMQPVNAPRLIWCFVDLDLLIHRRGYDPLILRVLERIEELALALVASGAIVAAHSDHGLVPTSHDPSLERIIEDLAGEHSTGMGGAGRARWLYPKVGHAKPLFDRLISGLPSTVTVSRREAYFDPESLAFDRVGDIILLANGDKFIAPIGYRYDHGSRSDDEIYVPFSRWGE